MKYIVAALGEEESIFTCPRDVDHDRFAESIECIRYGSDRTWTRKFHAKGDGAIIAAGFIDAAGNCYGRSETLNLDSRGAVDTALFKKAMGG